MEIGKILDAAEEVMSKKGVKNSSIAEIAKIAGCRDSIIYNYFQGKEDLLCPKNGGCSFFAFQP